MEDQCSNLPLCTFSFTQAVLPAWLGRITKPSASISFAITHLALQRVAHVRCLVTNQQAVQSICLLTFDFELTAMLWTGKPTTMGSHVGWLFLQDAFVDFLTNSCIWSQAMVANDKWAEFQHECWLTFSFTLMSKTKVEQRRRHMLEFHSFVNDMSDFFAESGNDSWILEYCLHFLCYTMESLRTQQMFKFNLWG